MKNGKALIAMCFRDISARDILGDEHIRYNSFEDEVILKLMELRQLQYSRNELRGQLAYFQDECEQYARRWGTGHDDISRLDIFSLIYAYISNILFVKDDSVCCKYEKFLHWRMLTLDVHEDLLICAFLANHDSIENLPNRTIFDWPVVIGHNNTDLNMILKKGMAENHFHLKGSAPAFHIAWNYFMNNPITIEDEALLQKIDKTSRTVSYGVSKLHGEDSLEDQLVQAAAIRAYLFSRLLTIPMGDEERESTVIKFFSNNRNILGIPKYKDEIYSHIYGLRVAMLSKGINLLRDYAVIDRDSFGQYCMHESLNANPENSPLYRGERHFMYMAFQDIKEKHILTDAEKNLFFAYLVIKERFRGELQQINSTKNGFENFSIFESRKGFFADNKDLVHDAMVSPMNYSGIRYLEARICPYESAESNRDLIDRMDSYILSENKNNYSEYNYKFEYAYVMHFVKEQDTSIQVQNVPDGFLCRHYSLREKLNVQAEAIVQLREKYPEHGKRIVGIDACNQEIGCRPEVFAPVFRLLRKHTVQRINRQLNLDVPQLRTTYHVGEDFLDPLDGLRAIDEAIKFFNLGCGDRFGHALALGIDVKDWYKKKIHIILPAQDYLDNITWLYFALDQFNVEGFGNLKSHLLDEFNYFFNRIYRINMRPKDIESISRHAEEYYSKHQRFEYLYGGYLTFDIHNYYHSWELRGDDPEYYKKGYFEYSITNDYRKMPHRINERFPEDFNSRMIAERAMLYYFYHFDKNVKVAGSKYISKSLHPDYIKAVSLIQKKMQKKVATYGIAIEANPTSNFLISNFNRYDKHPMIKWYNHYLESDPMKIDECPQISVSINTDDEGVFTTRLDNEYSLMALALERVKDENNNPVYDKNNIYKWIDQIRRFGISQNFICQNKRKAGESVTEDL